MWKGVGWVLEVGGKPKAGYTIHWNREGAIMHSVKHRNSHSVATCQVAIVGSSLTPHVALLVCPNSTRYPTVDCHEFTVLEKCCL